MFVSKIKFLISCFFFMPFLAEEDVFFVGIVLIFFVINTFFMLKL